LFNFSFGDTQVIHSYADLPFYERLHQSRQLRGAVAALLKRRGKNLILVLLRGGVM
jgi:hypothetical protein